MRYNRHICIEKQDVRSARAAFLRAIARFLWDGRAIYVEEKQP
jgi:hypothetical protein